MISAVSSNFSADPFDILWCKALVLMDLQLDCKIIYFLVFCLSILNYSSYYDN